MCIALHNKSSRNLLRKLLPRGVSLTPHTVRTADWLESVEKLEKRFETAFDFKNSFMVQKGIFQAHHRQGSFRPLDPGNS